MEDFAEETSIFGLNLMRKHVPKSEKILWLCLTVLFSVFTIRDLSVLVKAYAEDETLTSVSLNDNQPIEFNSPPTIWLHISKTILSIQNISNDSLLCILKTTFAKTKYPETLPDLLFETNIRLFEHISLIEGFVLFPEWVSKASSIEYDLLTVYNFYRENNISLVHLQMVTALMLCTKIGLTVRLPGDKNETNVCHPEFIAEFGGLYLAVKLSLASVTFQNPRQELRILIGNEYIRLVDAVYIDFKGLISIFRRDEVETIIILLVENQNKHEFVLIGIEPVLKFKRTKRANRECTALPDRDCETRCVMERFFECTHCRPFGAPFRLQSNNDIEICPGDQIFTISETLERCFSNQTVDEAFWTKCENICKAVPLCEVQIFTHTESRLINVDYFAISCNIQSFSFPVFEEKLALSFEAFMSQFGGVLGLYLGISFAALVHIPVFFIRLLVLFVSDKSDKSQKKLCHDGKTSVHFQGKTNDEIEVRFKSQHDHISRLEEKISALCIRVAAMEK